MSSAHEAALLGAVTSVARPVVILLPIDRAPRSDEQHPILSAASTDVAILGYVYPGKGHGAAIEALDVLPNGIGLTALGRLADGHRELGDALHARATRRGRRFSVAGLDPRR